MWDIWMKNQTLNYLWLSITYESVVFQEYIPAPKKITLSKVTRHWPFLIGLFLFGCKIDAVLDVTLPC